MQEAEIRTTLADLAARLVAQDHIISQLGNQTQENATRVNRVAGAVDQLTGEVLQNSAALSQNAAALNQLSIQTNETADKLGQLSLRTKENTDTLHQLGDKLTNQMGEIMSAISSRISHPFPQQYGSSHSTQPQTNNPPIAETTREPKLQLPNRYEGQPGKCQNFLAQCDIFFQAQPSRYGTEEAKICFIMSLLAGRALDWAGPLIRSKSVIVNTLDGFQKALISVFDHNIKAEEAAERLMNLNQGRKSVAEFAIMFRSIATSTGWPDEPLMAIFNRSLSEPVRYALSLVDVPTSLDALVERAIRIDNRIREQGRLELANKSGPTRLKVPQSVPTASSDSEVGVEPMQVDGTEVSKPKRKTTHFCTYCKKSGHSRSYCWDLNGQPQ